MRIATALAVLVPLATSLGCGGAPPEVEAAPADDSGGVRHGTGDGASPSTASARVLGVGASFGDLVAAARRLDDRQEADSDAGCILRGAAGAPWRLEADLSVAVRPLPDAPPDLEPRLTDADHPARVLTRWGQLGAEAQRLALVTFTSTPPLRAEGAAALFLTDRGAYLRRVGNAELEPTGPVPLAEAGALLTGVLDEARLPVFVTAEANVPLEHLRTLLAAVPESLAGATALAVPLAPETRLPGPNERRSSDETALLCPDGLPVPTEGAEEGVLQAMQIVGAIGPLREGARSCFAHATGTAAVGGRLALAIRIGPEGAVTEACFTGDEIGDPALRACVLEAARATHFPTPDPRGFVDAVVPLAFEPDTSLRQSPLCR